MMNRPSIFIGSNRVRRRGSVYIAVLGVSLIVVTLAVGGIMTGRVRSREADASDDVSEARTTALSALELTRLWISQDSNWRATRTSGNWTPSLTIGGGTVSINVTDIVDGDFTNRPYDPVTVTATAQKGMARHVLAQTLSASPTPLPALRYALTTAGQFHVASNMRLITGLATISMNGSLNNQSTIEGNVEAGSVTKSGVIFGVLTNGAASKAMPDSGVPEAYAKLGTLISVGSLMNNQVLSTGLNPYGAVNADGVYVIRASSAVTIRNCRINGTLVIIAPGNTVTIDQGVLIQPARTDYPALIINGNAVFSYTSATGLSEATLGTNFNPAGAPYQGVSDSDTSDTYPSEIDGLVHITGTLNVTQPGTIRGAVICESSSATDAVVVNASGWQIVYDSTLYTNPPQFYTTSVQMIAVPGSTKQIVN